MSVRMESWAYAPGRRRDDWNTLPLHQKVSLLGRWPCAERHGIGYMCSRPKGHTGRHAAAAFGRVVAVWASAPQEGQS